MSDPELVRIDELQGFAGLIEGCGDHIAKSLLHALELARREKSMFATNVAVEGTDFDGPIMHLLLKPAHSHWIVQRIAVHPDVRHQGRRHAGAAANR